MVRLSENAWVSDVVVQLARSDERIRRVRVMNEHHELGFDRFAGLGLRHVAQLGPDWVGLAGWQAGAVKCQRRDRFIGWRPAEQFT